MHIQTSNQFFNQIPNSQFKSIHSQKQIGSLFSFIAQIQSGIWHIFSIIFVSISQWIFGNGFKTVNMQKQNHRAPGIYRPKIRYNSMLNQYVNKNQSKLETNRIVFLYLYVNTLASVFLVHSVEESMKMVKQTTN